jgi:mono/diheme cytochrome c family protein
MFPAKALVSALIAILFVAAFGVAAADDVADGKAIYVQYCASCHGLKGDGNGPMASVLTTPPTNLRLLSQKYGNPLPANQIAKFIDGRSDVKAHGPRDMPVWGQRFNAQSNGNEFDTQTRITKLVAYLQSIQSGIRTAKR